MYVRGLFSPSKREIEKKRFRDNIQLIDDSLNKFVTVQQEVNSLDEQNFPIINLLQKYLDIGLSQFKLKCCNPM